MADDVQPPEPPAQLLDVAHQVVPGWLRRITVDAARRGGVDADEISPELDEMLADASTDVLERLATLLETDVDEQRTTPLTLFRQAVRAPTAWLLAHQVRPPSAPPDSGFPDDVYRLGPATWSDIDAALHEPGLTWGAWKAMTVLARRRDDGLR